MNESLASLLQGQLKDADVFHQPFAAHPDNITTKDFEIVFLLKGTGELTDISINMHNPEEFDFEDGTHWDYMNDDISDELAITLCQRISRTEWLNDIGIDYNEDCEIYWTEENKRL